MSGAIYPVSYAFRVFKGSLLFTIIFNIVIITYTLSNYNYIRATNRASKACSVAATVATVTIYGACNITSHAELSVLSFH